MVSRARDLSNFLVQDSRLSNIDSDYVQLRQATADLSNLNASNLTSRTIPDARISSVSVTQHVSAVTQASGSWTPEASNGGFSSSIGRYVRISNMVWCWAHAKFSTRTTAHDYRFFVRYLPYTSSNVSPIISGGAAYFNGLTQTQLQVIVRPNDNRVRFFSAPSEITSNSNEGTSNTESSEYVSNAMTNGNRMLTVRNLRQSSNNGSQDWFYMFVHYQV